MTDDRDLSASDIQVLASRDGVASFFAALGYDTDTRLPQTCAAMGISAESLQRQVKYIERVAVQDNGAEPLDVYLVELTSVTVAATQGLARALRNRAGNYLLVLTDDYERLDFVLLERALPSSPTTPMTTRQVSVRPRILTVNRRNPSAVQLRVLRRFTYTEADSDAQYDKLLSAYSVAEWAEPLFNNRALFSDYYLNERLPERPEWRERPEAAYRRLRDLLSNARQRLSGQTADTTLQDLVQPSLEALGFKVTPARTESDGARPHYALHSPESPDKPMALCLAYVWNRNLDGRDETRDAQTADENPGARVVTLLVSGEAPWAIVTNGKLWRLYSARAHSRATNYYEIDLEETLAMGDPNVAFRYFWLLFRAAAFVPRDVVRDGQTRSLSFLDELVEESESYAKGLGERLKDRVFEEIFPHFAEGFIEHLRGQPPLTGAQQGTLLPITQQLALKQEPDEEFRRQVFHGTLTFLYRLLFLLYAESRDLLPAKEVRGYWEHSITRLKEEIAARAGDILDEAPAKLRKAYTADSTLLYDRLLRLFAVVDRGHRDLNVPLYNGGLFITNPDPDDRSPEAENARFLMAHRIPDRYLALGLDRLARDIDPKRQSLVFIDYKSMGVRQLGSIYEGLLEFKVRVAPEKMAVVQGKKTEEVIPYREAVKAKRKVLTRGRGRNAEERTYRPGEVYLENDRRERKATGSYYTPDHIVKYIVEHTVGPVLLEKVEKLRPRFREAQQAYRNAQKRNEALVKQRLKPEDLSKVAHSYRSLVDELFDLRVLDPAMGSGHFLVEAVDFICDRILGQRDGFLQAFPWNPVTAFLDDTRRAILTEMERQSVTIDTGRLTDINLLKRHVLKRCIYGVDLNPMAVELAKVSLWLDCFTLGAPLSFLDHHLKCGNSLIGTTVQEVEAELAAQKKGHVGDLFGGPFQGLLSATAMIEELRRIPDATVEQAERSRDLFRDFEKSQEPYKRALDIWVTRHFGNARAREYLQGVGRDLARELRSGGNDAPAEYRDAVAQARELSQQKRFFHWDLEFPEAFVDLKMNAWKPEAEQGFDAVVGNPPYGSVWVTDHRQYVRTRFESYDRQFDIFGLFIELGHNLSFSGGYIGYIVPNTMLALSTYSKLRSFLRRKSAIQQLINLEETVFVDSKTPVVLLISRRSTADSNHVIRAWKVSSRKAVMDLSGIRFWESRQHSEVSGDPLPAHEASRLSASLWVRPVFRRAQRLGTFLSFSQGIKTANNAKFVIRKESVTQERSDLIPCLTGSDVQRYHVDSSIYIWWDEDEFRKEKPGTLRLRDTFRHRFCERKIVIQRVRNQSLHRRIVAAIDESGSYFMDTLNAGFRNGEEYPLECLVALLNSRLINCWFSSHFRATTVAGEHLASIPVRQIERGSAREDSRQIARRLTEQVVSMAPQAILPYAKEFFGQMPELARVMILYEALCWLAHQMGDLNQTKNAQQKGFLGWLSSNLGIRARTGEHGGIDSLVGVSRLRNYLGDYEKNEDALSFDDLWAVLLENRARISRALDPTFEEQVRARYMQSLEGLLPIKRRLAITDPLIDKFVYLLYDLEEEDIAFIEAEA